MTLSDFLLARIAEDEAMARAATPSPWVAASGYVETPETPSLNVYGGLWDCEGSESLCMSRPTAEHVARHEPARVLARCMADRRIVELHHVGDPHKWEPEQWACRLCQWDEDCDSPKHEHQHGAGRFPCDTLRLLALPYADHPDYDQAWRPQNSG